MSEAVQSDLTPSEPVPKGKGPPPLLLGEKGSEAAVGAWVQDEIAHLVPGASGRVALTKRGAAHLGRWLLDWSRPQTREVLWTQTGIAQELGVSRQTVKYWTKLPHFPRARKVIGGANVWEATQVKAWDAERPRRSGAQHKRKGRGA